MFGEVLKHSIITIKTAMGITLPINAILNCFPSPGILSAFASYSLQSAGQKYSCTKVGDTRRSRGSNFGRETTFYRRPIILAGSRSDNAGSEASFPSVWTSWSQSRQRGTSTTALSPGVRRDKQGYTGVHKGIRGHYLPGQTRLKGHTPRHVYRTTMTHWYRLPQATFCS